MLSFGHAAYSCEQLSLLSFCPFGSAGNTNSALTKPNCDNPKLSSPACHTQQPSLLQSLLIPIPSPFLRTCPPGGEPGRFPLELGCLLQGGCWWGNCPVPPKALPDTAVLHPSKDPGLAGSLAVHVIYWNCKTETLLCQGRNHLVLTASFSDFSKGESARDEPSWCLLWMLSPLPEAGLPVPTSCCCSHSRVCSNWVKYNLSPSLEVCF